MLSWRQKYILNPQRASNINTGHFKFEVLELQPPEKKVEVLNFHMDGQCQERTGTEKAAGGYFIVSIEQSLMTTNLILCINFKTCYTEW